MERYTCTACGTEVYPPGYCGGCGRRCTEESGTRVSPEGRSRHDVKRMLEEMTVADLHDILDKVDRLESAAEDMVVDYGQLQIQLHEANEEIARIKPVYEAARYVIEIQKRGEEPGLYALRLAVDRALGFKE